MATKEEKFLIALSRLEKQGEIDLNPLQAASSIGLSEKSMKNSINMLAQTNFLKKHGPFVQLTPQGRALVESLVHR